MSEIKPKYNIPDSVRQEAIDEQLTAMLQRLDKENFFEPPPGAFTTSQYMQANGITNRKAHTRLSVLVKDGTLETMRYDRHRYYWLAE